MKTVVFIELWIEIVEQRENIGCAYYYSGRDRVYANFETEQSVKIAINMVLYVDKVMRNNCNIDFSWKPDILVFKS